MAESPASSTSGKPAVEELVSGLLIPDTAPFDPITADQDVKTQLSGSSQNAPDDSPPDGAAKEIATAYEEAELGNSIERELFQLTIMQAKIEADRQRLEAVDVQEEGEDVKTVKKENLDEDKKEIDGEGVEEDNEADKEGNDMEMLKVDQLDEEKNDNHAEISEEENENDGGDEDEMKVEGQSEEAATKLRRNHSNNGRRINYPMRPDAEDCAYYMKFGTCKFGLNCKFNHPPRRRNQVCLYT